MTDLGTVTRTGETHTVHFERLVPHPPAEVWAALTEPGRLANWLTDTTIEPRLGGAVAFDFGDGGVCDGTITAFDPPHLLEYEWRFPNEHESLVRWELAADDDGRATRLRLRHTLLEPEIARGYGAGWHAHLDQLAGHLAGDTPEWLPRYQELRLAYDSGVRGRGGLRGGR